jgi:hypothetical protein
MTIVMNIVDIGRRFTHSVVAVLQIRAIQAAKKPAPGRKDVPQGLMLAAAR